MFYSTTHILIYVYMSHVYDKGPGGGGGEREWGM